MIDANLVAASENAGSLPTPSRSPWLHAWHDPLSNLKTTAACVRMGDINGDGDAKLIICDLEKNIKVFKGTSLAMG